MANPKIKKTLHTAKALVHIKYDKENYKPGDEFEVRESDVKELKENGYATVKETSIEAATNSDDKGEKEPTTNSDGNKGDQGGK